MSRSILHLLGCAVAVAIAPFAGAALASEPGVTTRMLVEVKELSSVAISPDDQYVAFREVRASVERNTHDSIWYVQKLEGAAEPVPVADGGPPLRNGGLVVNEPPQWSQDSLWIYYRALLDGEVQIWRADRNGGRVEQVTRDEADVEAFWIRADGEALIYRVGAARRDIARAEQEEYDRGVRFDDSIFAGQGLFRAVFHNGRLSSERTDGRMTRRSLLWDAPKRYRAVDLGTLAVRDATTPERESIADDRAHLHAESSTLSVAPGGRRVATLSENADGQTALRVGRISNTRSSAVCGACENLDIVSIGWRNAEELVVTFRDADRGMAQSLYLWRPNTDDLRLIAKTDGLLSGDRRGRAPCAISEQEAICVAASAMTPPRLERVAFEDGRRSVLFDPNARLARAVRSVNVELLTWNGEAGRAFSGYFFTPSSRPAGARLPLFVTYYVCPGFLRGGFGDEWPLIPMAQAGIATLCVNGRLPPKSGRDAVEDYDSGLQAVSAVIALLDGRGLIDPQRVGMGGLSFGGEVTLWTASHSDLLAAASVSSSAASPTWYWFRAMQAGFEPRAKEQWGLGSPDETPERWRILSPAYYADQFRAPILMQMAEQEYRSVVEYYVRMRRAGAAAELWAYPHEPHIKFQPRHKLSVYDRNLDWFRYWLQDYADPASQKADQYRRWRELRENSSLMKERRRHPESQ